MDLSCDEQVTVQGIDQYSNAFIDYRSKQQQLQPLSSSSSSSSSVRYLSVSNHMVVFEGRHAATVVTARMQGAILFALKCIHANILAFDMHQLDNMLEPRFKVWLQDARAISASIAKNTFGHGIDRHSLFQLVVLNSPGFPAWLPEILTIPTDLIVEHCLQFVDLLVEPTGDVDMSGYPPCIDDLVTRAVAVCRLDLPTVERWFSAIDSKQATETQLNDNLDNLSPAEWLAPIFQMNNAFEMSIRGPSEDVTGPIAPFKYRAIVASEMLFNYTATVIIQQSQRWTNNNRRPDVKEFTEMHRFAFIENMRAHAMSAFDKDMAQHMDVALGQDSVYNEATEHAGKAARYLLKAVSEAAFYDAFEEDTAAGRLSRHVGGYLTLLLYFLESRTVTFGASYQMTRDRAAENSVYSFACRARLMQVDAVLQRLAKWGMGISHYNLSMMIADTGSMAAFGPLMARVSDDSRVSVNSVRMAIAQVMFAFNLKEHTVALQFALFRMPNPMQGNCSSDAVALLPAFSTCLVMHEQAMWAVNLLTFMINFQLRADQTFEFLDHSIDVCLRSPQPFLREIGMKIIMILSFFAAGKLPAGATGDAFRAITKTVQFTSVLLKHVKDLFLVYRVQRRWLDPVACFQSAETWAVNPVVMTTIVQCMQTPIPPCHASDCTVCHKHACFEYVCHVHDSANDSSTALPRLCDIMPCSLDALLIGQDTMKLQCAETNPQHVVARNLMATRVEIETKCAALCNSDWLTDVLWGTYRVTNEQLYQASVDEEEITKADRAWMFSAEHNALATAAARMRL